MTFFIGPELIAFRHIVQAKSISFIPPGYHDDMSKTGRPPKTNRSAFGERLQFLREQAKLTQREVAEQLGISQPSYVKWERRDIGLTRDRLHQLASILGVDVENFFSADDQPKRNGPVGRARKTFETISSLSRSRQKQILDVVEILLRRHVKEEPISTNGG
jgi:transcriptional regulator with XRE-family HTH domain